MNNPAKVIVIDDDKAMQDSLKAMLQIAGYGFEAYASCRGFIENVRLPEKACVILDLHLQDMGAWEPVAFLEKCGANIPVILTARAGDPVLQTQRPGNGTITLLEKPFDRDLLLTTIKAILR